MSTVQFWRMRQKTERMSVEDFIRDKAALASKLAEDEVRLRTRFIALDPYLARLMRNWPDLSADWKQGIIQGRLVGQVIESRSASFVPGDYVLTNARWQKEHVLSARKLERIPPEIDPPSLRLGLLGASGLTAWVGLALAAPVAGETLLVSAAAGPVGSVVGQIAAASGVRTIGIAGGEHKCALAVERYGYSACVDHRKPDLAQRIAELTPDGADILFENTGGANLDAALMNIANGGRIMLCGLAAHYNSHLPYTFPNFAELLYRQITLRGFATANHPDLMAAGLDELLSMKAEGKLNFNETIIEGLDNAPAAYLDMLAGNGIGKMVIRC